MSNNINNEGGLTPSPAGGDAVNNCKEILNLIDETIKYMELWGNKCKDIKRSDANVVSFRKVHAYLLTVEMPNGYYLGLSVDGVVSVEYVCNALPNEISSSFEHNLIGFQEKLGRISSKIKEYSETIQSTIAKREQHNKDVAGPRLEEILKKDREEVSPSSITKAIWSKETAKATLGRIDEVVNELKALHSSLNESL